MDYQRLIQYFKTENKHFIDYLKNLVSYQTYTLEVERINHFVTQLQESFEKFQPLVTNTPTENGDILTLTFYPEKADFIVLLAHMDTVKVTEKPMPVTVEKNRLVGNGCYDMKNAIALFYFVIKALQELSLGINKQIKITFSPACISNTIALPSSATL